MTSAQPKSRSKQEMLLNSIVNTVENVELTDFAAWNDLDVLSTHTYVDGIEVDPAGIVFETPKKFNGIANIYLLLEYGNGGDAFQTSESFLGRFRGHVDETGTPTVEDITVDTSSFYEGEEAGS